MSVGDAHAGWWRCRQTAPRPVVWCARGTSDPIMLHASWAGSRDPAYPTASSVSPGDRECPIENRPLWRLASWINGYDSIAATTTGRCGSCDIFGVRFRIPTLPPA